MRVCLVFDPNFGERCEGLAALGPLWMIDSDDNRRAARKLRQRGNLPPDHVTTFDPQVFADILPTVVEHHPSWQTIHVYGATLGEIDADISGLGLVVSTQTPDRLVLIRRSP